MRRTDNKHGTFAKVHREYAKRKRQELNKAIMVLLPPPQKVGPIHVWRKKDVPAAEKHPDFQAWMAKRRTWPGARCLLSSLI
ncbi:hypothetical protein DQZ30_23980 [Salmonella enterica subsp. diarizonae]|nr:hypothetical protein [Salmonella enterica subsp. diarizonae]